MTTHSLEQLQRDFAGWLLGESEAGIAHLVDGRGLAPADRLQIYRNMVAANFNEALGTAYPMIRRLVGEEAFDTICGRYIRHYPSANGMLQTYGKDMANLLAQMDELEDFGYLPDVARLEWARQRCVLAPFAKAVNPEELASVPMNRYEDLRLTLSPSLQPLDSDWPVLDIWLYCEHPGDRRLDVTGAGQAVAVWRSGEQLAMAALGEGWYEFIEALANDEPLGEAYKATAAHGTDFDATSALEWLFGEGLVSDLDYQAIPDNGDLR